MKPSEVLRAAKAKIDSPKKWTKGVFARGASGAWAYECSSAAVCWCSVGALFAVAIDHDDAVRFLLFATGADYIERWNDAPERTHAEVMDAFDRAVALAEEKERA